MTSREKILQTIATNKPALLAVPVMQIDRIIMNGTETVEQFIKTLAGIGGTTKRVANIKEVQVDLEESIASGNYIVNTIAMLGAVNTEINSMLDANALEPVYKTFIAATLGVAENGSVWLYESQIVNRLLPFICQHLIICLSVKEIVPTMQEAYQLIDVAKEGYGVFVAGPSKTADIEQSLVIGAHGARSLLVYLID